MTRVLSDLKSEIAQEIQHCTTWAKTNFNWAQVIFILSVLSSFFAAILVGVGAKDWTALGLSETGGRIALAMLTGMPASLLLINNTLRFEDKAKWCWKKCRKAERLYRILRDDPNANIVTISTEFSTMSEELENEWPAFGASPSQPKKPGT
jgi:hypothetical protein